MGLATPPVVGSRPQGLEVVVRLADEGVPLRAIARATHLPSETVRKELYTAKSDGRLSYLPREDWPPGCPREERALRLSRLVIEDRAGISHAIAKVFDLTSTEARLLLLMVQCARIDIGAIDMTDGLLKVHIHNLRKRLKPFDIIVETLWGNGYQLSVDDRRRVTSLVLAHVAALASL